MSDLGVALVAAVVGLGLVALGGVGVMSAMAMHTELDSWLAAAPIGIGGGVAGLVGLAVLAKGASLLVSEDHDVG